MQIPEKSLVYRLITNILEGNNGTVDRGELLAVASKVDELLVALLSVVEKNLEHSEIEEIVEITQHAMHLVKLNKAVEERNNTTDDY